MPGPSLIGSRPCGSEGMKVGPRRTMGVEERANSGDEGEADLAGLLRRLSPALQATLRQFRIPPEDADDVVQQVLLQYVRKRSQIRAAEPWLRGAVTQRVPDVLAQPQPPADGGGGSGGAGAGGRWATARSPSGRSCAAGWGAGVHPVVELPFTLAHALYFGIRRKAGGRTDRIPTRERGQSDQALPGYPEPKDGFGRGDRRGRRVNVAADARPPLRPRGERPRGDRRPGRNAAAGGAAGGAGRASTWSRCRPRAPTASVFAALRAARRRAGGSDAEERRRAAAALAALDDARHAEARLRAIEEAPAAPGLGLRRAAPRALLRRGCREPRALAASWRGWRSKSPGGSRPERNPRPCARICGRSLRRSSATPSGPPASCAPRECALRAAWDLLGGGDARLDLCAPGC